MSVKLYYEIYKNGNLGDVLTKDIFTQVFNVPTTIGLLNDSECIGIGSVLQNFINHKNQNRTINVWGSGFIKPKTQHSEMFSSNMNFFAVRGKLTKSRISKMYNKEFDDITLGDPGLLASLLINNKIKKRYKLGIIPHFIDSHLPVFHKINSSINDSVIIDVLGDPIQTIRKMSECEAIISTSLHGLIIADSLGIPNSWCEVSKNVIGDGYKFQDYYSVFNNTSKKKPIQLLDIHKFDNNFLNLLHSSYDIKYDNVLEIREKLIKSFPYHNYSQSSDQSIKNCNNKKGTLFSKLGLNLLSKN